MHDVTVTLKDKFPAKVRLLGIGLFKRGVPREIKATDRQLDELKRTPMWDVELTASPESAERETPASKKRAKK